MIMQSPISKSGQKAIALVAFVILASGSAYAATGAFAPLNVAFYSALLTSLLVCMLINIAIKNPPGINYTIMFLLGLAYVWASDGGLTATGFDEDKARAASSSLGMVTVAFGFHTAIAAFDPRRNMRAWRVGFYLMAVAALLLIPLMWFAPLQLWSYLALFLFLASLISHAVSTSTWKHHDETQQSMPVVASVLALFLIGGGITSLATGFGRDFLLSLEALKLVFAMVMIPTMSAVIFALADVRLSRDHALEEAVEAAQRDAKTSASLLEMEKQYNRAREAASARSRQLSSASHDIRQPLASMRAELDTLRDDAPTDNLGRLDRVLDHLEELTHSLSASGNASVETGLHGEVEIERVEIKLLFDTLDRLFQAEAAQANIELAFEISDEAVSAPPLVLIRILSNLISNAVQHSGASKLVATCVEEAGICNISISDDGRGFDNGQIDWAMADGVKGSASDGSGLGLSIVRQLCEAYHLPLKSKTGVGEGSLFTIQVPAA